MAFNPGDNVLIHYVDATKKTTIISGEIDRMVPSNPSNPEYWVRTKMGVKLLTPENLLQGV